MKKIAPTEILQKIESALYHRGFTHEGTRHMVRNQIVMTGGTFILALMLGWFLGGLFSLAAGAALATFNFWFLAKFVQLVIFKKQDSVAGLLAQFYGRLFLTGLALYVLLVPLEASAIGILIGLSTVVVTMFIWGVSQMMGKTAKEA